MYILHLHKLSSRWRSFETDKVPPYQPTSKRSPRAAPQKPKHALRRICYSTPPGSYIFPISVLPPVNMDHNELRLSYIFDTTIQPSTTPRMRHSDNSARDWWKQTQSMRYPRLPNSLVLCSHSHISQVRKLLAQNAECCYSSRVVKGRYYFCANASVTWNDPWKMFRDNLLFLAASSPSLGTLSLLLLTSYIARMPNVRMCPSLRWEAMASLATISHAASPES